MTSPALIERITRSLAYMLRHQPEEFDLQLDSHGFGDIDAVVHALNERLAEPVDRSDLEAAISSGDRPRYEIRGDRVRALYGHSIDVEPGEPSKPPEFLYVGVSDRDADRAMRFGLRGGRRRFLHLALTPEDAKEGGRRTGRDYVVITVYALDAWEEGINFYDRQALFLAEQIPTEFLEISETCHDGFDRPAFGHPAGRGANDEHREHREHRPERASRPERAEHAHRGEESAPAWGAPPSFESEPHPRAAREDAPPSEVRTSEPRGSDAHDRVAERSGRDDRGGHVAEHVGRDTADRGPRDSRGHGGRDSGDRGGRERGGRRGGRGRGDRPPMGAPGGTPGGTPGGAPASSGEGFARDRGERPGGEHRERSPDRSAGPYSGPPRGEQGHRDSGGGHRPHRDARPDSRDQGSRDHAAPRDFRPEGREREREPNRRPDFREAPPREPRGAEASPSRTAPAQPAPEVRKRAEPTAVPGSFGLGIFEEPKAPQRPKSPPPEETRREAPAPPPPEETRREPEEKKKSGGGGFGAGI